MKIKNLAIVNDSDWLKFSFIFKDFDLIEYENFISTCYVYHDNDSYVQFLISESDVSKIWINQYIIKDVHEITLDNMYNKTFLLMISDDICFSRKFLSELFLNYLDFNERV